MNRKIYAKVTQIVKVNRDCENEILIENHQVNIQEREDNKVVLNKE